MFWKSSNFDQIETRFTDNHAYHKALLVNEAKGYVLKNRVEDIEAQIFSFQIDTAKSFEFDKMMTGIYLVTLVWIIHCMGKIQFLEKQKVDLILVRNFQFSQESDSDDDSSLLVMDIGLNSERRRDMLEAEQKKLYR